MSMGNERGRKLVLSRADLGWFLVASFGLALCLMANGVYDNTIAMRVSNISYGGAITESPWSGGASIIVMCLVLAVALHAKRTELRVSIALCVCLSLVLGVSLAVLFTLGTRSADGNAADIAGGCVLSAGSTLLIALWVQVLSHEGRTCALTVLGVALLADTLLSIVIQQELPEAAGDISVLCAVVVSPLLCLAFVRMRERTTNPGESGASAPTRESSQKGAASYSAAPATDSMLARSAYDIPFWLSIVLICIYSFAMGDVQSIGSDYRLDSTVGEWVYRHATSIAAIVIAVIALAIAPMHEPHGALRVTILIVLMFAVYLSIAFGVSMEPVGILSMSLVRMLIVLYVWLLACDIPWRNGWQMYAFAIGWGTFTLVNTVSTRIGMALEAGSTGRAAYDIAAIACLAALVLIELVARKVYANGLAGVPGADSADVTGLAGTAAANGPQKTDLTAAEANALATAEDPIEPSCRALAKTYDLTARELEVLVPLVHGRSAATIAQTLGISTETARTHIRHIYQKTDIHNREDLMDAVEAQGSAGTNFAGKTSPEPE